ncbi:MAG: hypothetical protein WCV73_00685 [Patescibacteria group bacterium]|jgi:hypothetical protein
MFHKIFPKINKSKLPKSARRWSLSVIFVYPTFVIANKLWIFLYVYLIINLFNFILLFSGLEKYLINLISVFTLAIFMFFTFYLVLYGRALAWNKSGYRDIEEDVVKFKLRQRIIMYVNILLIGLVVIYLLANLEYGQILSS